MAKLLNVPLVKNLVSLLKTFTSIQFDHIFRTTEQVNVKHKFLKLRDIIGHSPFLDQSLVRQNIWWILEVNIYLRRS